MCSLVQLYRPISPSCSAPTGVKVVVRGSGKEAGSLGRGFDKVVCRPLPCELLAYLADCGHRKSNVV